MTETKNIDEFDELKLYFGDDYIISDRIKIHQPTLGEIIELGEQRYFAMIQNLTCIPSNMKSVLWDHGIDYETLSDFSLFCMLAPLVPQEDSKVLFGDAVDFSQMKQYTNTQTGETVLAVPDGSITIDEFLYLKIVLYLRKLHNIKPKIEYAATKGTKEIMIMLDRQDRARAMKDGYKSTLLPLISTLLNSPGFKYKKSELKEVHYYEFMDSVRRIVALKNADQLMQGIYAGNVDAKKLSDKKALDGFRDLSSDA